MGGFVENLRISALNLNATVAHDGNMETSELTKLQKILRSQPEIASELTFHLNAFCNKYELENAEVNYTLLFISC